MERNRLTNKELLVTCGFPRSGNTYLAHALHLLYFPEEEVNVTKHTVKALETNEISIVPFRNPLDCLASWNIFGRPSTIEEDANFYLRFFSAVLNNLNKALLFDFDIFTKDLEYIKTNINKKLNLKTTQNVTDSDVKGAIRSKEWFFALPKLNQEELEKSKEKVKANPKFYDCMDLYNRIKDHSL